ncbi:MAG TPA: M13 family metallopeptidase N-terminal domain-containing protein, partial [Balneolaceae bacterium]|nr:M13 family metallopeptidase N-terminal domain-containing protein [Balneolaceae bacterium]
MKKFLSLFAATLFAVVFINSCGPDQPAHPLDFAGMDSTVSPADNFFLYANGTWLKNAEIPPSKTGWGSFYIVRDNTLQRIHTIVDSVSALKNLEQGSIEQQVADLYDSAMDSVDIEEKGLAPLRGILERIASLSSPEDVVDEVAREYKNGNGTLFAF